MAAGYSFYNLAASQQLGFAQQHQLAWAQAQQLQNYGQHPGLGAWSNFSSSNGFSQQGSMHQWVGAYDGQQSQHAGQCDPVDVFLEELGIHPSEDMHFGWIAEYGLQAEVMPPRWSMHTDATTGRAYYVDADLGTSSWENPLTDCLRVIIDIGRRYLHSPTDTFFTEQKDALWDQHKTELACWHGPLVDDSGRPYFSNLTLGVSSWHDPREETQFIYEIECNLLDALEDALYGLQPADLMDEELPTFGLKESEPRRTETGAEILTLDAQPLSPQSPGAPRTPSSPLRASQRIFQAAACDADEQKCTFEKMVKTAGHLNDLCRDAEEAQRLVLSRKVKERRLRQQRIEEAAERARRDEEALKMVLAARVAAEEEERKAEILRQMKEEQQKAEEALQKKLAEEEAARLEEERRAEEEREKERQRILEAERQAEAARKAEERRKKLEAEKARQEEEAREMLQTRLLDVVQSQDLEALHSAIADGVSAGLENELEPVRKAFREQLVTSLTEVAKSRDLTALRSTIAYAEECGGFEDELVPLREALEEEVALRKAATLKARKAKEDLAAQFKSAKEAQDFGGAILAAQWKAAVKEVAKPAK